MANSQSSTCQIRYTLDLAQLGAFETYARSWISLIERYALSWRAWISMRRNC